jgi:hypothetical protein
VEEGDSNLMASDGIFDIFTVSSLFQKLQHDHGRVAAAPYDRWAAIDFILTADSLRHWATIDADNGSCSLVVQICRDLAIRSKHWRARLSQVKDSKATNVGFQFGVFQPDAFQVGNLIVVLKGDAEQYFGSEIGLEVLANETLEFWRTWFAGRPTPE